ncbi:MAG TPA: hypothetical protein VIO61_16260 [Anaerolineaceae bacterium]
MSKESIYTPFESLEKILRGWWLLALCMITGAAAGYIIHTFQPPVYEARARLGINLNFTKTGAMTDIEEDLALNAAGDVVFNAGQAAVLGYAQEQGLALTKEKLNEIAFFERRFQTWELRLRSSDPDRAAQLANVWMTAGRDALVEAHDHAQAAEVLQRRLDALETCLQRSISAQPVPVECTLTNLPAIQREIAATGAILSKENLASQGVLSGLLIAKVEPAEPPVSPVIYGRGVLIFAGVAIGFIAGLLLVHLPWNRIRR